MPCYNCVTCPFDNLINKDIIYELHITPSLRDKAKFLEISKYHNIKTTTVFNCVDDTEYEDTFTSYTITKNPIPTLEFLSAEYRKHGVEILREKIETVPWHPAAPSKHNNKWFCPSHQYFESHLEIENCSIDALKSHGLHVSKGKTGKILGTLRTSSLKFEALNERLKQLKLLLDVKKVRTEFALYDSNLRHDDRWMANTKL